MRRRFPSGRLRSVARSLDFSERTLCDRLGLRDAGLLRARDIESYWQKLDATPDTTSMWIAFWLLRRPVRSLDFVALLGEETLTQLQDWGFLRAAEDDLVYSEVDLYPCRDDYLFTDMAMSKDNSLPHPVYELGTDSYLLTRTTPRPGGRRALDLCTGSGVHAVASAGLYDESIGVDLNPRALRFARINAAINGVVCEFLEGDLYAPVSGQFDLITINPPFVPTPDTTMQLHRTGGKSGEELSRRAIAGLPTYLAEQGTFSMILDFPEMRSSTYLERIAGWLGDGSPSSTHEEGWGILLLHFGFTTLEEYVSMHVPPENFAAELPRYLKSYDRQGIYRIAMGAVIIRRQALSFAREEVMLAPSESIADFVHQAFS